MHLFWLKFQPRHFFFSWKRWLVQKLWSSEVHDWIPGITTLRLTGYCSPYNHLITVIELPLSHTFEYAIQNRHSNCFTCYRKLGYNGTVRRASVQPLVGRTTPCSFSQRTPTPIAESFFMFTVSRNRRMSCLTYLFQLIKVLQFSWD